MRAELQCGTCGKTVAADRTIYETHASLKIEPCDCMEPAMSMHKTAKYFVGVVDETALWNALVALHGDLTE